jgi:hypothetical protein
MMSNGWGAVNPSFAAAKPSDSQLHSSVLQFSASTMLKSQALSPPPVFHATGKEIFVHKSQKIVFRHSPDLETENYSFEQAKNTDFKYSENHPVHVHSYSIDQQKKQTLARQKSIRDRSLSNESVNIGMRKSNGSKSYVQGVKYVPYTLKDYKIIKPVVYLKLGGLGPVHVGQAEWVKKTKLNQKRLEYGSKVALKNSRTVDLLPVNSMLKERIVGENTNKGPLELEKRIIKPTLKNTVHPYNL